MTTQTSRRALQLRLWALFMPSLIPGLLMASWAIRTPAICDQLMLSTAEVGMVLFDLSVRSMGGTPCPTWLVKCLGIRKVIRTTMSFAVLGMLVSNPVPWVSSAPLLTLGLTILGASFGSAEAAINIGGAAIEREMNRTVLSMMHGFYSFGILFGAGVSIAVTGSDLPAAPHILATALVAILPIVTAIRAIPDGTDKNTAEAAHGEAEGLSVRRDAQLLLIGVIVSAMVLAEGSANDWLSLLMVDGRGFSSTSGSLIYAGFTLGMMLGHFTGGWFIDRYSRVMVVHGSAVMGVLGIGLIIFIDNPWVASILVLLWGTGASLGFSLTISAASDTGPDAPKRVSVVAIIGYFAFLVGSLSLGLLGEHLDLRSTTMVVLGLVIVATLVARAVAKPQSESVVENS